MGLDVWVRERGLWSTLYLVATVVLISLAACAPLPLRNWIAALLPLLIGGPIAAYVVQLAWRIYVRSRPLLKGVRSLNPKHFRLDAGYLRGLSVAWEHGPHHLRLNYDEVSRPGGCYLFEVCLDTSTLLPKPLWFEAATRHWEPSDRLFPERQWEATFLTDEEGPSGPLKVASSEPETAKLLVYEPLMGLIRQLEGSMGFPGAYVALTPSLACVRKVCPFPDSLAVEAFVRTSGQIFSHLLQGVGMPPLRDFTSFKLPSRKG